MFFCLASILRAAVQEQNSSLAMHELMCRCTISYEQVRYCAVAAQRAATRYWQWQQNSILSQQDEDEGKNRKAEKKRSCKQLIFYTVYIFYACFIPLDYALAITLTLIIVILIIIICVARTAVFCCCCCWLPLCRSQKQKK